jgi:hypothetical protein
MSNISLLEYMPFQYKKVLNENSNSGGPFIVEGVVQRAGAKNQNGRIYPKPVLAKQLEVYKAGPIAENRAYGELDHPDSQVISLGNVCHVVRDVWWDGDDVIGKIEILDTPSGKILKELFNNNLTVGISSRGMGSVKEIYEQDALEVQDDFELLCWDFVSTPSTHGAFVAPVHSRLNEGSTPQPKYLYNNVNNIISDILCSTTGMCGLK